MKKKNDDATPLLRVKEFHVMVPTNAPTGMQPVIGLLAITENQEILIPLADEAAKEMSDMVAKVLMLEPPETLFPA